MPKDQILRPRRRPNRIRLYESHPLEHPRERRGGREAPRDGVPPKPVDGEPATVLHRLEITDGRWKQRL
jgi:hypothetical protein